MARDLVNAWDHGIVGRAARARVLAGTVVSAPLLLGLLGSVGYVSSWFGADTTHVISDRPGSPAELPFGTSDERV